MQPRRLSRRRVIGIGAGMVGALAAAAGCAPGAQPPAGAPTAAPGGPAPASTAAGAPPGKYKESPDLAQLVKDGKLPPIEQRLPKEPMVITPIEKVGTWGGAWRTGTLGPSDSAWFGRTIGYESLVRWDVDWKNIVPDIAKKYEVSPDGKSFTFSLREGMKWSDGKP